MFERIWNSPTFTTWGKYASRFAGLVLVLPVILVKFSPEEISCYYLFLSAIALTSFLENAFATTYTRTFSFAHAGAKKLTNCSNSQLRGKKEPNLELLRDLVSTSASIQFVTLSILLVLLGVGGSLALAKPIGECDDSQAAWIGWAGFATGAMLRAAAAKDAAAIRGIGFVALANRWDILFNLLAIFSTAAVLAAGGDLAAIGYVQVAAGLAAFIRYTRLRRHVAGGILSGGSRRWNARIFKELWAPTWRQIVLILLSVGVVQASGLYLAQLKDGVELTSYLLALRLITVVSQLSQAPFYSHIPTLSAMRGTGEIERLALRSGRCIKRALLVFWLGASAVGLGAPAAIAMLGSETEFVDPALWLAMSTVFMLERHHAMHVQIVVTSNKVPFVAAAAVTGTLHFTLMLFLAPATGAWGLVFAHGIANLAVYNWLGVRMSMVSLGDHWGSNIRAYLGPVALTSVAAALALWILPEPLGSLGASVRSLLNDD